jgi:hypothetical protein
LLEGPRVFALAFRWQSEATRRSHR